MLLIYVVFKYRRLIYSFCRYVCQRSNKWRLDGHTLTFFFIGLEIKLKYVLQALFHLNILNGSGDIRQKLLHIAQILSNSFAAWRNIVGDSHRHRSCMLFVAYSIAISWLIRLTDYTVLFLKCYLPSLVRVTFCFYFLTLICKILFDKLHHLSIFRKPPA